MYSSDGFSIVAWLFVSQRHLVPFSQPCADVIVAGMSSAADCAVCMEMNQLLILQPRGGRAGSMAGSLLFQGA